MENKLTDIKDVESIISFINKLERTNYDESKNVRSILEECIHFHLNKLNILFEHPGTLYDKIFRASNKFDRMILTYKPSEDPKSSIEIGRVEPYAIVECKSRGFYSLLNEKIKELKSNIDESDYLKKAESIKDFIEEAEYYTIYEIFWYWSNIKDECNVTSNSTGFNFFEMFGQEALKILVSKSMIEEYYNMIKYCREFLKEVRKLKEKFEV